MATTTIIPLHIGKGRTVATALGLTVDYVKNPNKTENGEWITSYECDPLIADQEFLFSKNQYAAITGRDQGARDVIGFHLRISFMPGETDAQTANKIGYDLAMKLMLSRQVFSNIPTVHLFVPAGYFRRQKFLRRRLLLVRSGVSEIPNLSRYDRPVK